MLDHKTRKRNYCKGKDMLPSSVEKLVCPELLNHVTLFPGRKGVSLSLL
jgi:hypothetical protein